MSTLPPEIISDILRRLPVKSLLRFRCASKPWCSIIDHPHFTKLHLNFSIKTNSNQRLILNCPTLCSFNLDLLDRAVEIDHPLKSRRDNARTGVIGSSNGLLCLNNCNSDKDIVLFNMSTGKHLNMPAAAFVSPSIAAAFNLIVHSAEGFGYDSVHDDFKILKIAQFLCTHDSEVMLYGLKSNSWKRIQCFPYGLPVIRSTGVLACGALHWGVNPKGDLSRLLICAFDLATEEYHEVPEPPFTPDRKNLFLELGVLDGSFCVVCNYVKTCSEFWVMKEYGVKESWAKLLSISQPQHIKSFNCVRPLVYLSNRNELLFLQDSTRLLSYDLERNIVKRVRIGGMPDKFDAVPYVESLVNPVLVASASHGDGNVEKQGKRRNKKNVC